jgi:hypothetical protein
MDKEVKAEETPRFAKVELSFLQALLDYLKTRPYEEVYYFVDVLTGRNVQQAQQPSLENKSE